jgi:tRNA(fMet)-specific endonuclease VapC
MKLLLDTNIILTILRGNQISLQLAKKYELFDSVHQLFISSVSKGEMKSISIQNNWGKPRLLQYENLLQRFIVVPVESEDLIDRYAEIDAFSQGRHEALKSNFSARNMGKNDLWIAATASVLSAKLLTTDADFLHLENVFLKLETVES